MQFGITARQNKTMRIGGKPRIMHRREGNKFRACLFQQSGVFRIPETERFVTRKGDAHRFSTFLHCIGLCCPGRKKRIPGRRKRRRKVAQAGQQGIEVDVGFSQIRQSGKKTCVFGMLTKFCGLGQAKMTRRQGDVFHTGQYPEQGNIRTEFGKS